MTEESLIQIETFAAIEPILKVICGLIALVILVVVSIIVWALRYMVKSERQQLDKADEIIRILNQIRDELGQRPND